MKFFRLALKALGIWIKRDADHYAAALAYFTPFALTPLIIFSISLVGFIFGGERVTSMLVRWGNAVDVGVTDLIYKSVQNFDHISSYYYWPVIGTVFVSVMIYITLNTLIAALHKVWSVEVSGLKSNISRLWRITLFIFVIQIYLVSIIILSDFMIVAANYMPTPLWSVLSYAASFLLTMMLLALAYGLLSLQAPSFKGRFIGASVAGVLLLFSRELVALHFATAPVQSLFGAAGLLITLLVWVYVGAGIILYGAAFARVYDESKLLPLTK